MSSQGPIRPGGGGWTPPEDQAGPGGVGSITEPGGADTSAQAEILRGFVEGRVMNFQERSHQAGQSMMTVWTFRIERTGDALGTPLRPVPVEIPIRGAMTGFVTDGDTVRVPIPKNWRPGMALHPKRFRNMTTETDVRPHRRMPTRSILGGLVALLILGGGAFLWFKVVKPNGLRNLSALLPATPKVSLPSLPGGIPSEQPSGGGIQPSLVAPAIEPPPRTATAGKIIYCTDPSDAAAPFESMQAGQLAGSDVEIGTEISHLMGVKAEFVARPTDTILSDTSAGACDVAISDLTITAARSEVTNFVRYMTEPYVMLVRANATTAPTNVGYSEDQAVAILTKTNASGETKYALHTYQSGSEAVQALSDGTIEGFFGSTALVANLAARYGNGTLSIRTLPVDYAKEGIAVDEAGIAVPKDRARLRTAVDQAVALMYSNGDMCRILSAWGIGALSLSPNQCGTGSAASVPPASPSG